MDLERYTIQEKLDASIRLENDINGNPRFYIPCYLFSENGEFRRPNFATKYRGKKYGQGWVFQSYNLKEELELELEREVSLWHDGIDLDGYNAIEVGV
jgi:hypothetical protein